MPARPLCSRCSVTPPPGSADFRRALRSGSAFPSFWATRVRSRKRRSSKTASPSQRPTILPCPRSVCPSVCQRGIKRKHEDDNSRSQLGRSRRKRWCGGSGLGKNRESDNLNLLSHFLPTPSKPGINSQRSWVHMLACEMSLPASSSGHKNQVTSRSSVRTFSNSSDSL